MELFADYFAIALVALMLLYLFARVIDYYFEKKAMRYQIALETFKYEQYGKMLSKETTAEINDNLLRMSEQWEDQD